MSSTAEQCMPGELWTPGRRLDHEYPVPTGDELVRAWSGYTGSEATVAVKGVYGALVPAVSGTIRAIASVDLCEVVRQSSLAVDMVDNAEPLTRNHYGLGKWYGPEARGNNFTLTYVENVLRPVMSEGYVMPDPHASAMAAMLRNWRRQGIYTVANTSTLAGCELGTIKHTLGRDMPGAFDALLLPRNHDGLGTITKAGALRRLAEQLQVDIEAIPVAHIDDATHHIRGFQTEYTTHGRLGLFGPRHRDNADLESEYVYDTPFEAFLAADKYFAQEGITHAR